MEIELMPTADLLATFYGDTTIDLLRVKRPGERDPNVLRLGRLGIGHIDRPAGRAIAWAFRRSAAERNLPGCRCRRPDTALWPDR